jgi:aminoglycoside phosphotransferase (APT) family kinase protein
VFITGNRIDLQKLESYLITNQQNKINLVPEGAQEIWISNVINVNSGAMVDLDFFSLTYNKEGIVFSKELVLKSFHEYKGDLMCARQYQVTAKLWQLGYPVPKPYFCEVNSDFLGSPFVITDKERANKESIFDNLECFASTLAMLHNLNTEEFESNLLKPPQNPLAYGKKCVEQIQNSLNEIKLKGKLKANFDKGVQWLKSNLNTAYCPKYCLLHGDYNPGNVLITKTHKMVVLDWDWVEIGDPACDVGYAYHQLKFFCNQENPKSAKSIAEQFLLNYSRTFQGQLEERLKFYKIVGALRVSIMAAQVITNPIAAYKYHGFKALSGFPFIHWPFAAKWLDTKEELSRMNYFGEFFESAN